MIHFVIYIVIVKFTFVLLILTCEHLSKQVFWNSYHNLLVKHYPVPDSYWKWDPFQWQVPTHTYISNCPTLGLNLYTEYAWKVWYSGTIISIFIYNYMYKINFD